MSKMRLFYTQAFQLDFNASPAMAAAAAAVAPPWAAGTAAVAEEYTGCFPVRMPTAGGRDGMPAILILYPATNTRKSGVQLQQ